MSSPVAVATGCSGTGAAAPGTGSTAPAAATPDAAAAEQAVAPQHEARTHRYRNTEDIESSASSFGDLLLPQPLVQALAAAGFQRPSPVQQAAIPLGLVGSDLIVQAKSGTGKTCVFAVIALQRTRMEVSSPQALVLAPTRELALQSADVISRIAAALPAPAPVCQAFVGGLPTSEDSKRLRRTCHIVVGTPGRMCALLASGSLAVRSVRLFVMDEADALVGSGFYPDIAWAHGTLPSRKQVLAFSATYTPELMSDLEPLMSRPQRVLLCEEGMSLSGIRQFYAQVEGGAAAPAAAAAATAAGGGEDAPASVAEAPTSAAAAERDAAAQRVLVLKVDELLRVLGGLSFHQAVVFTNCKPNAEWLARRLTAGGFPAVALTADLPQPERSAAVGALRAFTARVLVATDVAARGVDLDRVNLVLQLEPAPDAATHVHRIGRTGRFGTRGVAVSLVTAAELAVLRGFVEETQGGDLAPLPPTIPADLYSYELTTDWERTALEGLRAAQPSAPPDSPPPLRRTQRKKQQLQQQQQEEEEEQEEEWEAGGWGAGGGGDAGPGEWTRVEHTTGSEAQQAWEAWQAWQVWQAWQSYYAGGVQPQPGPGGSSQQQPGSFVWRRDHSASSSSSGGRAPHDLGADVGGGSCDGGSASVPDDEDLEPHGRALLSSLVVALEDASAAPSRSHVPDTSPSPVPTSPTPATNAAAPACPHCCYDAYTAWQQAYSAWCADYDAWRKTWAAGTQ